MRKKKKIILAIIAGAAVIGAGLLLWRRWASTTDIAFVNYQAITLGQISRANDNPFIKIHELSVDDIDKAGKYDMVMVNGMGLRITDDQREQLTSAAESGTPVITTAATNPQNQITSVDSIDDAFLRQYLRGGRANYRNMLEYVRKFIDGKKLWARLPGDPVLSATSLLYYPSDTEELGFHSVREYEGWLKRNGKWKEGAPRIILTGQMGVADSLVAKLEKSGNMVYPVSVIQPFIADGHADSIKCRALINMAHGRMGDEVTAWLETHNIPLFSPVNANRDYDEWMDDKMGMSGGFMSQSIVTPEIDGAIRPFTLFAHFKGSDGLPHVEAIPGRVDEFVATVNNYVSLGRKANKDKKLAIFYFKGPGQSALVAEGMEVAPSLYNLLKRLKEEGYAVEGLPADAAAFERLIAENGRIFNEYATGARADFVARNHPQSVSRKEYDEWCGKSLPEEMREEIDALDGQFPGHGLNDGKGNAAVARIRLGNVVLIPQPAAGLGDDDFKIVHGTDAAPPHNYVAAYLWARHGFGADALLHFGAHGSLEFTPRKQAALGSRDWPDRLVGPLPHFYVYSTSNVGEAMIAKRRSYAGIVNYLTPPFMESKVRGIYKNLSDAVADYNRAKTGADSLKAARLVRKYTLALGIHRELRIDSTRLFSPDDIARIEGFAEELANEKITGALYVMGVPYSESHIRQTVEAMAMDPLAYSLQKLRGGGDIRVWRERALRLVRNPRPVDDAMILSVTGLTQAQLDSARKTAQTIEGSRGMLSRMMVMGSMMPPKSEKPLKISERRQPKTRHAMIPGMSPEKAIEMARKMGADDAAIEKMKAAMTRNSVTPKGPQAAGHPGMKKRELSKEEIEFSMAVMEVERALRNIGAYRNALLESPGRELSSIVNALNGGFIAPTSGGDPVLNPDILPTGRNMFAVNAEETPSAVAWEKGKDLAEATIRMYRKVHGDSIPRKVSYTLWSSEFIETEGATIAQVLYMLGVEPVRDPFGRVTDLRLIPSEELGRPRIDVVVQTSGQLRDLAASRLFLIGRAVKMAAEARDDAYPNYVAQGVTESERHLVDKGVSPKEARELSTSRGFGGVNGNYGSGIQSMVEAGDRWEDTKEIASTYISNMGASYDSEEQWEQMREYAFEAALTQTDVVVQPRQSNTWGALSLDHVYEFMGGMNLAVKEVTGKEPDAYLSDYRNRNNARMQEVKEAIGVESRTTILNPEYIKEKMKGGAGDAAVIAETITNTYGWNVMKPDAIDNELWNDIYDTYIADKHTLGVREHFEKANPAAIEEMTAVMLESARKGLWKATPRQLATLAQMHTEVVERHGAACTGFVCDNAKLRDFIASKAPAASAAGYKAAVAEARAENVAQGDGKVMKKESLNQTESVTNRVNGVIVAAIAAVAVAGLVVLIRRRRKTREE